MVTVSGLKEKLSGLPGKLGKFKYPILILLLGLILMVLPGKAQKQPLPEATEAAPEQVSSLAITEERLSGLLSKIRGAGAVEVMLSLRSGEQVEYQSDVSQQWEEGSQQRQESNTVLYSSGSGVQSALVRRVEAPVYQGAVVVCQEADDPAVKLAIVESVSSVTGLGADQITVVKMK